jgi:hypothetical protein
MLPCRHANTKKWRNSVQPEIVPAVGGIEKKGAQITNTVGFQMSHLPPRIGFHRLAGYGDEGLAEFPGAAGKLFPRQGL